MTLLLGQANGSNAALITFAIYTVVVFGLAVASNQFQKGKSFLSEYFLGSRSLGMWAFALTFAATSASGGSFTGFPSLIYTHGWVLALWIGSYMLVPALMMGLMGKRLNQMARRANAITVPDVLCARFDSRALGTMATLLIIFFMTFNLVAQFKSGSLMLSTLLDDVPLFQAAAASTYRVTSQVWLLTSVAPGYLLCLVFFSVAVIVYTSYGGFRAVVWTDVLQGVVMVVGVLLLLPLVLYQVGGLEKATKDVSQMTPPRHRFVRIERSQALPTEQAIPLGVWLDIPAAAGEPRRVFRIAERCSIPPGRKDGWIRTERDTTYDIPVLEIRSPHEVERIQVPERDLRISSVHARIKVVRTGNDASARMIPKGSWLGYRGPNGSIDRAYQILEGCDIPEGDARARFDQDGEEQFEIPAIEVLSKEQIAATEFADLNAEIETVTGDYLFGNDQTGVYVSGPGPSAKEAMGFLPLGVAISFFFFWVFSGAGQPSNMVRLMSFNNSTTLRRAMMTVAIYFSLIYFPLVVIFCCGRVLLPGMEIESDRIMPALAEHVTRAANMPWLAGLLVAAPFAAVMSTVDSFLLMISSAIVRDVYQRDINPNASEATMKKMTYAVTVLVGVAALLGALNPPQYLQNIIVFTGGGLSTSFLIPVMLALYWPRFNAAGAIAGMSTGFLMHVVTHVVGWWVHGGFRPIKIGGFDPFIPGVIVSLVAAVVVAKLFPAPKAALVRRFFQANRAT